MERSTGRKEGLSAKTKDNGRRYALHAQSEEASKEVAHRVVAAC